MQLRKGLSEGWLVGNMMAFLGRLHCSWSAVPCFWGPVSQAARVGKFCDTPAILDLLAVHFLQVAPSLEASTAPSEVSREDTGGLSDVLFVGFASYSNPYSGG